MAWLIFPLSWLWCSKYLITQVCSLSNKSPYPLSDKSGSHWGEMGTWDIQKNYQNQCSAMGFAIASEANAPYLVKNREWHPCLSSWCGCYRFQLRTPLSIVQDIWNWRNPKYAQKHLNFVILLVSRSHNVCCHQLLGNWYFLKSPSFVPWAKNYRLPLNKLKI